MTEVGGIAADQLASYVERIERIEEEKANLMAVRWGCPEPCRKPFHKPRTPRKH